MIGFQAELGHLEHLLGNGVVVGQETDAQFEQKIFPSVEECLSHVSNLFIKKRRVKESILFDSRFGLLLATGLC